jgi:uncharacterized membrane protein YeaQ/YmgE (transglycosylase-associated protein family)
LPEHQVATKEIKGDRAVEDYSQYVPWIIMAVNGLIAGWLAGLLFGRGGLIRNIFLGIIGAFIGGALVQAGFVNLPVLTEWTWAHQIIVSTIGAFVLVFLARLIAR